MNFLTKIKNWLEKEEKIKELEERNKCLNHH